MRDLLPGIREWREAVRRFAEDDGLLLASALSYGIVLCLAPFTLIFFSVAGFLLSSDEIAEYVFDSMTLLMPTYGHPLAEFLVLLTAERTVTGLVGAGSLVIFASNVFGLARSILNRVLRVDEPPGWIRYFTVNVLNVALVGAVIVIFALLLVGLIAARDLAHNLLPVQPLTGLRRAVSLVAIYALGMAMIYLVYRIVPSARVPRRAAAVAAGTVMLLWELARQAFSAYVEESGGYGRLYGSFGIWVGGLVWIYYSTAIFVLGAEVAGVLTDRAAAPAGAAARAPSLATGAAPREP